MIRRDKPDLEIRGQTFKSDLRVTRHEPDVGLFRPPGLKASVTRASSETQSLRTLELGGEEIEDTLDVALDITECIPYWQAVTQAYEEGRAAVHFHLWTGACKSKGCAQNLCIWAQRSADQVGESPFPFDQMAVLPNPVALKEHFDSGRCHEAGLKHPVFVVVRKSIKKRGRVRTRIITSAVGLKPLELCAVFQRESCKHLLLNTTQAEVVDGQRCGESGLLMFDAARIDEGKLKDQIVKGAAEVMDRISDDHAQRGWEVVHGIDGDNEATRLYVDLGLDSHPWRFFPSKEVVRQGIKGVHMFLALAEFGSGSVQRVIHRVTST